MKLVGNLTGVPVGLCTQSPGLELQSLLEGQKKPRLSILLWLLRLIWLVGSGVVGFLWDSFRIQALLPLFCHRFLQQGWLWLPEEHLKIVLSRTVAAQ